MTLAELFGKSFDTATASRLQLTVRQRLMTGEFEACNAGMEFFMCAMCNFDVELGADFWILTDNAEQEENCFYNMRRQLAETNLPWRLPVTLVDMFGAQTAPAGLVQPPAAELARQGLHGSDALLRYISGPNCYVKLRSQETSLMLNKYREREQKEKRTQTSDVFDCREIYALLEQFSTLDHLQKQAVLNAFNEYGLSAIQGPPGTGKTSIIAHIVAYGTAAYKRPAPSKRKAFAVDCISQRSEPLFLIVTATNSAADHVAQQVLKLKEKLVDRNWLGDRTSTAGNVVLLRKYAKSFPTSAVPENLINYSNKAADVNWKPAEVNCVVMTMGHAKSFKFLARLCPHVILFEEASMANCFEFFGITCRFNSNEMRVTVMNRLRALRRQKAREEMPHDAKIYFNFPKLALGNEEAKPVICAKWIINLFLSEFICENQQ
ncbi:hypothetical protein GPALN_014949 [Globodera pallida]|nr:hypothetical protein GPALN_014949 [Globodera pallida]